jgi:hypothetical protein
MGKTLYFIFLFILSFGYVENTLAGRGRHYSRPSSWGDRAIDHQTDLSACSSVAGLETFNYLGIRFPTTGAKCITGAQTDDEAVTQCSGRIINPANPQYWTPTSTLTKKISGGKLAENPTGIYYCLPIQAGFKERFCNEMNNPTSDLRTGQGDFRSDWPADVIQGLQFRWVNKGHADGDCECRAQGSTSEADFQICNSYDRPVATQCPEGFPASGDSSGSRAAAGPLMCKCSANSQLAYAFNEVRERCTPPSSPASEDPTRPTDALKQCVDNAVRNADLCKTSGEAAKRKCDMASEENKGTNDAMNAMTAVSSALTNRLAGTGAQQTCFLAGAASNMAKNLIQGMEGGCDSEYGSCRNACVTQQNYDKFVRDCQALINVPNTDASAANLSYFNQHKPSIESDFETGTHACSNDAAEKKSTLDNLLTGLGQAMRSAAVCACQLSATSGTDGSGNCTSIPTPEQCAANPSLAGCATYGSFNGDACTLGASYNAALCECQTNPTGASCKTATSAGPSAFASGIIKSGTADSSAGFGGGGVGAGAKGLGGDFSLGSDSNDPLIQSGTKSPAGANLNSGGGGPAGGSGVGAGGGSNAAGVGGAPEEANKDSVFGQIRNGFSRFFGGKATTNGNASTGKKAKGALDPSKFRPTRGMASSSVGSSNADIWKMMNYCLQGETCKSNLNSYMVQP